MSRQWLRLPFPFTKKVLLFLLVYYSVDLPTGKFLLSAESKPPQIEVSGSSKRKLDLKDNGDNDKRAQKKFRVEVNDDKRNEEEKRVIVNIWIQKMRLNNAKG